MVGVDVIVEIMSFLQTPGRTLAKSCHSRTGGNNGIGHQWAAKFVQAKRLPRLPTNCLVQESLSKITKVQQGRIVGVTPTGKLQNRLLNPLNEIRSVF